MALNDSGPDALPPESGRQLEAALLRAARLLRRKRWTRGAPARDGRGIETDLADERAAAFCAAGAFLRAGACLDNAGIRAGMALLHRAARELSDGLAADVFALNDDPRTTKATVIAVLERAAALATARGRSARRVGRPPARMDRAALSS